jgi:hypothetical protein
MPDDVENYGEFDVFFMWRLLEGFKTVPILFRSLVLLVKMVTFMILKDVIV